jgi:hypothetical protein
MKPRPCIHEHLFQAWARWQSAVTRVCSVWKFRPPRAPPIAEYDDLIASLNKARRKAGIPPVFETRHAIEQRADERRAKRAATPPIATAAAGEENYEYLPPDDTELEQPRGYHP